MHQLDVISVLASWERQRPEEALVLNGAVFSPASDWHSLSLAGSLYSCNGGRILRALTRPARQYTRFVRTYWRASKRKLDELSAATRTPKTTLG